jgi:ligand-binding sensor domain-containing protein
MKDEPKFNLVFKHNIRSRPPCSGWSSVLPFHWPCFLMIPVRQGLIEVMKSFHFPRWLARLLLAAGGWLLFNESLFAAETNIFVPTPGLVIRSWGTEAGLPQNSVNAIAQTRNGYLWLATGEGLARFDGVRFTMFGLRDGLPSVEVHALCEDDAGTLWIGTSSGLSRLANGQIENVPLPTRLDAVVTVLKKDNAGRLWVGTRDGLGLYQNGNFIEDKILAELGGVGIQDLTEDHLGNIWIAGGTHGLFQFDHKKFIPVPGPPEKNPILAHCLLEDQSSNLWVSIGNGAILRRNPAGDWKIYDESNGVPYVYISCLTQEANGTIWAGSLDNGVYRFAGDHFTAVRMEDGLSANDIRSLYPDREGNLWIGTRIGGLNRLSRSKLIAYSVNQGLTNNYTRGIAESADGTFWVGTIGGGLYFGKNGKFDRVAPEMTKADGSSFYFAFINSVLAMTNDTVWYGGGGGLMRIQKGVLTDCFTNYPFRTTAVTALCDDGHGEIWIGTADSRLLHFQNGDFVQFPQHVARGTVTSLTQEPNGALWVGSEAGGLKRIDPDHNTVLSVTNGLLSQSIRTLYRDADGTLWIGTLGGGLSRYRNGQIVTFTTRQGLWADTISQIVPDDNGNLWCGCNHGIFRVSKNELNALANSQIGFLHPRVFGVNDGMLAEECSGGFCPAGLTTRSGLIGFSTVKGLVFINPELRTKTLPREAMMEEVVVAKGQNYRTEKPFFRDTDKNRQIVIPPGAWEIELHYTALDFSSPVSVLFRFRLL